MNSLQQQPAGWPRWRHAVLAGSVLAVATLTLSACGGGSGGSGSPSSASPSSATSSSATGNGAGARRPGGSAASGLVAAITGTTMQVQNASAGQVAVTWTSSTKFSHTVTATLAAIKAGECVTAIAPSGTSSTATSFTASTVVLSTAVAGKCTGGFGGSGTGRQRPSGAPSGSFSRGARPSGFPTGASRPAGGNFGGVASGLVTSVSGANLVIAATQFGGSSSTPTKVNKTVLVASTTKITTDAATTSSSLAVGKCITAQGKTDTSGTVASTSVRITDAVNGACNAGGFGGGGTNGG